MALCADDSRQLQCESIIKKWSKLLHFGPWRDECVLRNKLINDDAAGSENLFRTCFNFPYIIYCCWRCVFLTLHLT